MMNHHNGEKGQAVLLVVVAMGIFLIGAMGLAIDVSQLFGNQQMAQVAADAAAQAAMLSIFQGVNTNGATNGTTPAFSAAPDTHFTCIANDQRTPCQYAQMNGFGSGDTITVSFSTCALTGGICGTVAAGQANQVTVAISRPVSNSFIRMVGGSAFTRIGATGIAATLAVVTPVPILILHPSFRDTLSGNGNFTVKITGGPSRSIQVNSSCSSASALFGCNNGNAYSQKGKSGKIDLTSAGPVLPDGTTGADFGIFGGPTSQPTTILTGNNGKYQQPASPLPDPLLFVLPPGSAAGDPAIPAGAFKTVHSTDALNYGCTGTCTLYQPGSYPNGLYIKTDTAIFQPGVYVMNGSTKDGNKQIAFGIGAGGNVQMCVVSAAGKPAGWPSVGTGCVADPNLDATGHSITGNGMLVYNNSVGNAGTFDISANGSAFLEGTPEVDVSGNPTRYAGILFFENHALPAATHNLGGGGTMELLGTIYVTNTVDTILKSPSTFQTVHYQGNPGSTTLLIGMIITDELSLGGDSSINMQLESMGFLKVQQVALIGGGPH
jgi:Flp pilus assembly protein TadG